MAEENEAAEAGKQAGVPPVDPVAISIALGAAAQNERVAAKAEAYLETQRRVGDLQHEILAKSETFEVSHLRWRAFGDRMKGALQIIGVLAGLGVVGAFGVMVWNAAHSNGLIVDSFSMPPDLITRGLTGEVVASEVLDKVSVILKGGPNTVGQSQTASNSSSDNVKVEIPETGISLGELYRFLRRWLGHETLIGGEVVRTPEGLALTIRVSGKGSATYTGAEAGFDDLVRKASEHAVDLASPNILAIYIFSNDPSRIAEAQTIFERVISDPASTPRSRASALNALASMYRQFKGDARTQAAMLNRAREVDPSFSLPFSNGIYAEIGLGHFETALNLVPDALRTTQSASSGWYPEFRIETLANIRSTDAELRGDFAEAMRQVRSGAVQIGGGNQQYQLLISVGRLLARRHDGTARAWLNQLPASTYVGTASTLIQSRLQADAWLENWPAVIVSEASAETDITKLTPEADLNMRFGTQLRPWLALAKVNTGDIAGAESLIATSPGDCYDCVRIRGDIASEARQWARADYWFARAAAQAPSIPFAHEDWGRSLLARDKPDEAIAQFQLSNRKGPHFADPLEGWGEALMAKNQSHLALAKFADAEKYAPNWGRLHLKWGEALGYAGRKDEARAQYQKALTLDLSAAQKAELARQIRS